MEKKMEMKYVLQREAWVKPTCSTARWVGTGGFIVLVSTTEYVQWHLEENIRVTAELSNVQ